MKSFPAVLFVLFPVLARAQTPGQMEFEKHDYAFYYTAPGRTMRVLEQVTDVRDPLWNLSRDLALDSGIRVDLQSFRFTKIPRSLSGSFSTTQPPWFHPSALETEIEVSGIISSREKATGRSGISASISAAVAGVRCLGEDREFEIAPGGQVRFEHRLTCNLAQQVWLDQSRFNTLHALSLVVRLQTEQSPHSLYVHGRGTYRVAAAQDLAIDRIEFVQVVQNETNSIPLVAGKKTVARVFVRSVGENVSEITGITGALTARGRPERVQPYTGRFIPPAIAPAGPVDRDSSQHAVVFVLPDAWTAETVDPTAPLRVHAEVRLTGARNDADASNNEMDVFAPVFKKPGGWPAVHRVAYVEMCMKSRSDDERVCPSRVVGEHGRLMGLLFPAPASVYEPALVPKLFLRDLIYEALSADSASEQLLLTAKFAVANESLRKLLALSDLVGFSSGRLDFPDQIVGWLPSMECNSEPASLLSLLFDSGQAAVQRLARQLRPALVLSESEPVFASWRLAHELALQLGAPLRVPSDIDPVLGLKPNEVGEVGFNTFSMAVSSRSATELMVHPRIREYPVGMGVSPATYDRLWNTDFFDTPGVPAPKAARAADTSGEFLVVSGTLRADGSAGQLDPAYRVGNPRRVTAPEAGAENCLRFVAASGGLLSERCFSLEFGGLPERPFVVKAPYPPDTRKVMLVRKGMELASLEERSLPPVLSIGSPATGERWEGSRTVRWSASDPGGASRGYAVLYSPDGGESWSPLAVDLKIPEYVLDGSRIMVDHE